VQLSETITSSAQPSSHTLSLILAKLFEARDRKGKGKVQSEEELNWIALEKNWLKGFSEETREVVDLNNAADASELEATNVVKIEQNSLNATSVPESLYTLLLSVIPAPLPPTPPIDPDSPPVISTAIQPSPRLPAKLYYKISPKSTLQSILSGTTILEYPTLELWHQQSFLRARAKGSIDILDAPEPLPAVVPRERGLNARGSGRGGRGRGGTTSTRGGRNDKARDGDGEEDRVPDQGWGKRASSSIAINQEAVEEGREGKRMKLEIDADTPVAQEIVAEKHHGLLVDYGSD
jgi:hypothetical protein